MPDEVTKSFEDELDELDFGRDVYEEGSNDDSGDFEQDATDISNNAVDQDDSDEQDTAKTVGESDDGEEIKEEEETGEEAAAKEDPSKSEDDDEKEIVEDEATTSKDLDDQQRIADLIAEVNRLSGLVAAKPIVPQPVKDTVEEPLAAPVIASSIEDFIGDLDMDDVASDPNILNAILNKVLQKGIETGKELSATQVGVSAKTSADTVSKTIASQVESAITLKDMVDKFYGANPELSNVKQVVQACASQIVQDSPDKSFMDVLNMAAKAARKTLGISKSAKTAKIPKSKDAAFAEQKGGQRKKGPKTSKLQQELDEL